MKLKVFKAILLITAFSVIFFVAKYAFANLSYLKVDSYLTRWQKSKVLTQDELSDALISVDAMLSLHGHFPHYLNTAAKVFEWQAYLNIDDPISYKKSLMQSMSYYHSSVELRTHWPLTWIFMANIKSNLNEFDDDFYFYVDQAIKYGPYTYQVNLQIGKYQLQYWGLLNQLSLKTGIEHIKRALRHNKARCEIVIFSQSVGKLNVVCMIAKADDNQVALNNYLCRTLKAK